LEQAGPQDSWPFVQIKQVDGAQTIGFINVGQMHVCKTVNFLLKQADPEDWYLFTLTEHDDGN
jgi:hypothetical protein